MQNSKLLLLFKSLRKKELSRLYQFLKSPYFKISKPCVRLFEVLRKYYPTFDSKKVTKENIWLKVFSDKAFDKKKMTDLMSSLKLAIENFLVIQELEADDFANQKIRAKAFYQRNLNNLFEKEINQLLTGLNALPHQSIVSYAELAILYHQAYLYSSNEKSVLNIPHVEELMDNLDQLFYLGKLTYASEILNRAGFLQTSHQIKLLPEIKNLIAAQNGEIINPLLQAYVLITDLISKPSTDKLFEEAEKYILDNLAAFDPENQSILFELLLFHAIRLGNTGNSAYKLKQFELYKYAYEQNLLFHNNKIENHHFINVIALGAKWEEDAWIVDFIEESAAFLNPTTKELSVNLGYAYLHFHKKRFQRASEYLFQLKSTNRKLEFGIRSLRLRVLYELTLKDDTMIQPFFSECNNFDHFLKTEKILSKNKVLAYRNTLIILRQLARLKIDKAFDKQKQLLLLQKLNQMNAVSLKLWLTEKINGY